MFPFRRILIADLSGDLDTGLLRYSASVLPSDHETEITVASLPGDRVLRSLTPMVESVFSRRRLSNVKCRILVEPDVEGLFAAVNDCRADLLLTRLPRESPDRERLARRLISESPCSLWLAPEVEPRPMRRVAAAVGSGQSKSPLLRIACALARATRIEDLLAVEVYFQPLLDQSPETLERIRDDRVTELYCLMSRMDLGDITCSLRIEQSPHTSRALWRAALETEADLLIASAPPTSALDWLRKQNDLDDLIPPQGKTALLTVCGPDRRLRGVKLLQEMADSFEPIFN
jgi:hypothetical protein